MLGRTCTIMLADLRKNCEGITHGLSQNMALQNKNNVNITLEILTVNCRDCWFFRFIRLEDL